MIKIITVPTHWIMFTSGQVHIIENPSKADLLKSPITVILQLEKNN